MANEIQDVLDAIVALEQALVAPAGLKGIAEVYDEPPANFMTFPCFYNVEERDDLERPSNGYRRTTHTINLHLLFAAADQKYSVRERRKWVKVVLDGFDAKMRFSGALNGHAVIAHVDYSPVEIGHTEYVAATFVLRCIVQETVVMAS